jgi:hypothetical protein
MDTVAVDHDEKMAHYFTWYIQGGSNMTGTNCALFTHNQSRSYLNHLVHKIHEYSGFRSLLNVSWYIRIDVSEEGNADEETAGYSESSTYKYVCQTKRLPGEQEINGITFIFYVTVLIRFGHAD